MPIDEFWYEEQELLNAYIKAYFNNCKYTAWINGQYTYVAQLTVTSNMWGGEKGKKAEYPDFREINEQANKTELIETPKSNNDNYLLSQFY